MKKIPYGIDDFEFLVRKGYYLIDKTRYIPTLIELKFMKTDETNIDAYVAEACGQLDRYAADYHLNDSTLLRNTTLTKLYMVFQGANLIKYGVKS